MDETEPPTADSHRITLPPYDALSEFADDDAQEEEEEDTYSPLNQTNVPSPGYLPVREGRLLHPDYPSPELMELETGELDDVSQGVLSQEYPPLRIQPSRKCKIRSKHTQLDQRLRELTAENRQLFF